MLKTERLVLRPFTLADAPQVQRLAAAREIALNTLRIPHPYPVGAAEAWIAKMGSGPEATFAITGNGEVMGAIGLVVDRTHNRAELGYWLGVPFWGKGYTTEAARAMLRFGFEELLLNRIFADVFSRNTASQRVLQKIGMKHEGTLRQQFRKWDEYVDVECYGVLRSEYAAHSRPA